VSVTLAPSRLTHGTRVALLSAASFRTWRGSQASVAWDLAINTERTDPDSEHATPLGGNSARL